MNRSDAAPATEELEIDLLLEAMYQHHGFDFRAFDRPTVRRRLLALMQEKRLATVSLLQDRVLHEHGMAGVLLRKLGVAPAGLFDEPEQARQLRSVLVSCLRASAVPKVWLAECAGVEEAWTLAILLAEEQLHGRTEIFATVASEDMLAEVLDASIDAGRMAAYQESYLNSGGGGCLADYFDLAGGRAVLMPALRNRITWAQYNMVTDASFNEFQVIVCRRDLADYGPVLRQRTLKLFHESLARFGMLGLHREFDQGDAIAAHYQPVFAQPGWYKRVA